MWRAIVWAQFRILRNRFPRSGFGSILMAGVSLLWQGAFATFGVFLALTIPGLSRAFLELWLPAGLLLAFLYWQTIPLLTLSAGWSLQLGKLQIYPVSHGEIPSQALPAYACAIGSIAPSAYTTCYCQR